MMQVMVNTGVVICLILHVWFFILEMFLWTSPIGIRVFKMEQDFAQQSAKLAANQGLYNAFLSAGLLWGLCSPNSIESWHIKVFFLSCIVLAGVYAGLTFSKKILYVQALPAGITLLLLYLSIY